MGTRALESDILAELRNVEGKRSIKQKDIMEWALGDKLSGEIQEGEKLVHLTIYGNQRVTVAYKPLDK